MDNTTLIVWYGMFCYVVGSLVTLLFVWLLTKPKPVRKERHTEPMILAVQQAEQIILEKL